jgi:phage N-6-adenine-methyltransferase
MPNDGYNAATDQNDNWRTPDWLFKALEIEFAFECDGAADAENAKCALWSNNIIEDPPPAGLRVFCNPPYSNIMPFVVRALASLDLWVFILPVRTRAAWFEMLWTARRRVELRWYRKRIAFDPPPGVEPSSPRMDTFIAIVRPI